MTATTTPQNDFSSIADRRLRRVYISLVEGRRQVESIARRSGLTVAEAHEVLAELRDEGRAKLATDGWWPTCPEHDRIPRGY